MQRLWLAGTVPGLVATSVPQGPRRVTAFPSSPLLPAPPQRWLSRTPPSFFPFGRVLNNWHGWSRRTRVACHSWGRAEHHHCPGACEAVVTTAQGSPMSLEMLRSWERVLGHQIPLALGICLQDDLPGNSGSTSLF